MDLTSTAFTVRCLSKAHRRFQRGRVSPCMPAKWASPSTAAIHNSWESTSAPTRWYPGGTCTIAFSSLPTRSRCGRTKSQQTTSTKCNDWLLMNALWCSVCPRQLRLLPERYWQSTTLAPQPDVSPCQRWWPEGVWHRTGPLHQTPCVYGRQGGCYVQ